MYVVGPLKKSLKIGDKVYKPGDEVPQALDWKEHILKAHVNLKWLVLKDEYIVLCRHYGLDHLMGNIKKDEPPIPPVEPPKELTNHPSEQDEVKEVPNKEDKKTPASKKKVTKKKTTGKKTSKSVDVNIKG